MLKIGNGRGMFPEPNDTERYKISPPTTSIVCKLIILLNCYERRTICEM